MPDMNPVIRTRGLPVPMQEDVPPYLQMLFSARGRLPHVRPIEMPRLRSYGGIFEEGSSVAEMLRKMPKKKEKDPHPTKETKKMEWFEKLRQHIVKKREEYLECTFYRLIIREPLRIRRCDWRPI